MFSMQSLAKSRSGGRSMLLSEDLSLTSEFTALRAPLSELHFVCVLANNYVNCQAPN